MFKLMRLGLHFSQMSYGALDPLVLELIRTEQLMRTDALRQPLVTEPQAASPTGAETATADVRKAA